MKQYGQKTHVDILLIFDKDAKVIHKGKDSLLQIVME